MAAARTPSFASSSCLPSKARLEISTETVKPTPATAPPPAITGQLSPDAGRRATTWTRASRAQGSRAACRPRSRTAMPSVIGEVTASPRSCPLDVDAGIRQREHGHDRGSSSTGEARTEVARSRRSRKRRSAVQSGPARAWVAPGRTRVCSVTRSRSCAPAGRRSSPARSPGPRRPGRYRTRTGRSRAATPSSDGGLPSPGTTGA